MVNLNLAKQITWFLFLLNFFGNMSQSSVYSQAYHIGEFVYALVHLYGCEKIWSMCGRKSYSFILLSVLLSILRIIPIHLDGQVTNKTM